MTTQTPAQLKVPFVDFQSRYTRYRTDILRAVDEVLSSGVYILGEYVEKCEKALSEYLNCPYVITVANGTDALILVLKILNIGVGDEVIVPVNSFIASAGAIVAVGAKPVFCDVRDDLNIDVNQIEKHITQKTKAIMPVHLTGRSADMRPIQQIAKQKNLFVIEDAAQSIGAIYDEQYTGVIGDAGCFSLHPLKNLYAYGDAGFITTKNKKIYDQLKQWRNHGLIDRDHCPQWGLNSRLDSVQANIVLFGLTQLNSWTEKRRHNALRYQNALKNWVTIPKDQDHFKSVYHNFVILTEQRDALMIFLQERGIETKVHYPIPLHLQQAAKTLGYKQGDFPIAERLARTMISLPVYSELSDEQINYVIQNSLDFFNGHRN